MKSKSLGTKLLMALVCLAVLAYFGLQIWGYYTDPLTTAVAYSYQVEKGATVSGWVLEQVGQVPEPGDRFQAEGLDVTVTKVEHRRVLEIQVRVLKDEDREENQD